MIQRDASQLEEGWRDTISPLTKCWRSIIATFIISAALGVALSYAFPPRYIASSSLLPPQQQGGAASALASLGALSSLAGGAGGLKAPADQMVALMQSATVSNRIIEKFNLKSVYEESLSQDARATLAKRVVINAGKKDGLIRIDVEDTDPKRAADISNYYAEELRRMTSLLAISEAQQRRVFFEKRLEETKSALIAAQISLQSSGFNRGALQAEPKAAAETFAKLKAELTIAEVRLQALSGTMAESSIELRNQSNLVRALRQQVALAEAGSSQGNESAGYIGKYRDFKYQEMLFEMFARQYELARVDEGREGALIQVVDTATPPERKFWPKRSIFGLTAGVGALTFYVLWLLIRARLWPSSRRYGTS